MNLDPRDYSYDDYDNDFSDDFNDHSARDQAQNDMLDYTQELYDTGRIDKTQRDEMRMGA
tara:strand:+ start:366 stop:545 length:180 start_codon:yes stop_codon:yes gene_type:complete